MSDYNLMLKTTQIEPNNRKSLLCALSSLTNADCDFDGENGLAYLTAEVWQANGYEDFDDYISKGRKKLRYNSNLDFYIDKVSSIKNDEECISTFIKSWINSDCNYYSDYDINYIYDNNNKVIVIAIAVITNG